MASETPPRKRATKKAAPATAPDQPEVEPGEDDAIPPQDLADMGIELPDEGYWTDERLAELRGEVAAKRDNDRAQEEDGSRVGLDTTPPPLSAPAVQTGPDAVAALDEFTQNAVAQAERIALRPTAAELNKRPAVPEPPDPSAIWIEVRVTMGPEVAGAPAEGLLVVERVRADGVLYSALPPGVRGRTVKGLIENAGRKVLAQVPTGGRKRGA